MFSRVVVQNLLWYFLMNIQYSWCPKNVVVMQYNRVPSVLDERLLCNIPPCQNPAVYQVFNTKCFVTPKCIVLRMITDIKVIVKGFDVFKAMN